MQKLLLFVRFEPRVIRSSGHSHAPIFIGVTWLVQKFCFKWGSEDGLSKLITVIPCNYENPCIYNLSRDCYEIIFYVL